MLKSLIKPMKLDKLNNLEDNIFMPPRWLIRVNQLAESVNQFLLWSPPIIIQNIRNIKDENKIIKLNKYEKEKTSKSEIES